MNLVSRFFRDSKNVLPTFLGYLMIIIINDNIWKTLPPTHQTWPNITEIVTKIIIRLLCWWWWWLWCLIVWYLVCLHILSLSLSLSLSLLIVKWLFFHTHTTNKQQGPVSLIQKKSIHQITFFGSFIHSLLDHYSFFFNTGLFFTIWFTRIVVSWIIIIIMNIGSHTHTNHGNGEWIFRV